MNLTKISKLAEKLQNEHKEFVANEEWREHLKKMKIPKIRLS
jgi:hypothetical protein